MKRGKAGSSKCRNFFAKLLERQKPEELLQEEKYPRSNAQILMTSRSYDHHKRGTVQWVSQGVVPKEGAQASGRLQISLSGNEIIQVTNESAHMSPKRKTVVKQREYESRSEDPHSDLSGEIQLVEQRMLQKADSK